MARAMLACGVRFLMATRWGVSSQEKILNYSHFPDRTTPYRRHHRARTSANWLANLSGHIVLSREGLNAILGRSPLAD